MSHTPAAAPAADLTDLLAAWPYSRGEITARKITASDGRTLIQMRLDLGLLQMEATGRPDGRRPQGFDSFLDYIEHQRDALVGERGGDGGFTLTPEQVEDLREEGVMYYHRYLSLFVLGDFEGVVTDTRRNLRLLDFVARYAGRASDARELGQYRPYVLMMYARAQAAVLASRGLNAEARAAVADALTGIREHLASAGRPETFETAPEVAVLRRLEHDLAPKHG